jgi:glutamate synthase (NADPH/NADH) large chain
VDLCFRGVPSRIKGARFVDIENDQKPWRRAWNPQAGQQGGLLKFVHGGEYHMYNPDVVSTLQPLCSRATTPSTRNTPRW